MTPNAGLELSGTNFGLATCPSGQVLKSNGAGYACAADTGATSCTWVVKTGATTITAACPTGKVALSGGCAAGSDPDSVVSTLVRSSPIATNGAAPNSSGWTFGFTYSVVSNTAYALCCALP